MKNLGPMLPSVLSSGKGPIDWIFVPLVVQWVFVNEVIYPAYGTFLYQLGTFQIASNPVFPVTWASALILFVLTLIQFRFRYRVDYFRSIIYALGLALAATSLFEIIYQNVGAGQGVGNQSIAGQLINVSSMAMALASLRFWQPTRVVLLGLVLFLCGWLLWLSAGFPQVYDNDPHRALVALEYNAPVKVASFALMGLLVTRLPSWKSSTRKDQESLPPRQTKAGPDGRAQHPVVAPVENSGGS